MGLGERIRAGWEQKSRDEAAASEEAEKLATEFEQARVRSGIEFSNKMAAERAAKLTRLYPLLEALDVRKQLMEVREVWEGGQVDDSPTLIEKGYVPNAHETKEFLHEVFDNGSCLQFSLKRDFQASLKFERRTGRMIPVEDYAEFETYISTENVLVGINLEVYTGFPIERAIMGIRERKERTEPAFVIWYHAGTGGSGGYGIPFEHIAGPVTFEVSNPQVASKQFGDSLVYLSSLTHPVPEIVARNHPPRRKILGIF